MAAGFGPHLLLNISWLKHLACQVQWGHMVTSLESQRRLLAHGGVLIGVSCVNTCVSVAPCILFSKDDKNKINPSMVKRSRDPWGFVEIKNWLFILETVLINPLMLSPWAYRLKKKLTAKQLARIKKSPPMVRKYIDKNGKRRVYRTQLFNFLHSSPLGVIIITMKFDISYDCEVSGVVILFS